MMGYQEPPYTVEAAIDVPTQDGRRVQRFEIRATTGGLERPPYIALEGRDANGSLVLDRLFHYATREHLDQDWKRLTGPLVVKASDLNFEDMIVDHCIGYSKDGGITMY